MLQRRILPLLVSLLLLMGLACAPEAPAPEAATATPAATPAPVVTLPPTATPVPADYDAAVDFGGQPALLAAVQYALQTDDPGITYRALDTIDTLILADAAQITDIGVLKRAGSLKTLVIVDGEMDLDPLKSLPSLQTLTVTGGHFGDLRNVAVLEQLTALNLFGYDTTDFSPLLSMPKLTTLRLGNHAPCDLSSLAKLPQLTTLLLPDARGNDLSWLASLENLTDLTVWRCKQRYFDWLPALNKLKSLRLDMRTDCDLTPVGELTGLTTLVIDIESGRTMDDQSWLTRLTGLESLSLRGLYFGDLARLSGMTKLASLTLDDTRDSVRLYELPELPALTELSILNNYVVNASELTRYPSLKKLTLFNSGVSDPGAVYALTDLTELTMRTSAAGGDRRLGDVARVSGMVHLESLDWGGRAGDLDSLIDLRSLERLRLTNARIVDFTPLTKLPALRSLDLSGNRIKRIPASVADMAHLEMLDLSNCKNLHYIEALSGAPALKRLTLDAGRIRDPETLENCAGLSALTFVSGGQADPLTGGHTGTIVDDPALIERLRGASPYLNYVESERVLRRFYLKDYMHEPYYCSAAWYPAYDPLR